jgi:hypothetical protein
MYMGDSLLSKKETRPMAVKLDGFVNAHAAMQRLYVALFLKKVTQKAADVCAKSQLLYQRQPTAFATLTNTEYGDTCEPDVKIQKRQHLNTMADVELLYATDGKLLKTSLKTWGLAPQKAIPSTESTTTSDTSY